ncbi:MAG: cupin domain-containing protein [Bacteroidetes bacterium]|nr:cupin domain-containing protein [Bacteroidota bacterium]
MLIPGYSTVTPSGDPTKMTKLNQFESDRMFVDYYLLEPGQEQKPHTHAENDKLYFVLQGRGMFLLGETEHELEAGTGCVAEAGVPHGVRNHTADRLVLLVSMAPHPGRKG